MKTKDITIEYVKECSKKCNTKKEFQLNYQRAYTYARKIGVLDEVCSHMFVKNYSTPQLILKHLTENLFGERCFYNHRKLITPYEVDVYFENLGIAFEYDGERWHKNDKINKFELCKEQNVTLITIKEKSRKYEIDVKNQLVENINLINTITKKNIRKSDIFDFEVDYKNLLPNVDQIKSVCLKYNNVRDFKENDPYFYNLLVRRKQLRDFTKHMSTSRTRYNEIDIKKVISGYTTITDFLKNESKLYQHLKKHKLDHLLNHLKRNTISWTKELVLNEINKYVFLKEFKENSGGCYVAAIKFGLYDELDKLKKKHQEYTIDCIIITISKYKKLIDLIENDYGVYGYCLRNNLQHLYSHLEKRKKWSREELEFLVGSYDTLKMFVLEQPTAYSVIRKRHKDLIGRLKKYVK
jgi:hypothetical protein